MAQVQVRDSRNNPVPLVNIRLGKDSQSVDECIWDQFTDLAGNTAFGIAASSPHLAAQSYTLYVNYANVKPQFGAFSLTVPNFDSDVQIILPSASARANAIDMPIPRGRDFVDANGKRQVLLITDQFRAYEYFTQGKSITSLLVESRELGFGWWRTFFYYDGGIGHFTPEPASLDRAREFADILNANGIGLLAVALADSAPQQQERWQKLGAALKGTRSLLSLANEANKNGVEPVNFSHIDGVLCSRGSLTSDKAPPLPYWDFAEFHGRRDMPAMALDSVASPVTLYRFGYDTRIVMDEPIGWDDAPEPGRRLGPKDIGLGVRLAADFATWCAGLCFHSNYGIQSKLLSAPVRECARQWVLAAQGVADSLADSPLGDL